MKLWKFLVLLGAAGAVAAVVVAGINFLVLPSFVHSNKVVAVPDLRGASPEAATDLLRPLDLEVQVTRRNAHPTMGAGLIIEQVPAPQAGIRSGRVVKVILSSGPATSAVPDLVGLSERQAVITLERDTFQPGRVVRVRRPGLTEPVVECQEPQPGTRLYRGAIVSLVVAEPAPRQLFLMPDLRGSQLFQARQAITDAGLVLGNVSNERDGGGAVNSILEQKPAPGRRVGRGEEVDLVASSAEGRALVAPSLLSADFADLRGELASLAVSGADLLHLDVMDGHFVPNLTFGPFICEAIRRLTPLPLDAHLMMTHPHRYLEAFAAAGVDAITIHVEATCDVGAALDRIGELGCRRGLSLRPATDLAEVLPLLDRVDLVLVMSVPPGFGGQSFDPAAVHRIGELRDRRRDAGGRWLISVDGGINERTGRLCRQAGADILVSGSWLLKAADRGARTALLRGA